MTLIYIGLFTALGALLYIQAAGAPERRRSARASGVVTDVGGAMDARGEGFFYSVRVAFSAGGQPCEGSFFVYAESGGALDARYTVGETVSLQYDPKRPTDIALSGAPTRVKPWSSWVVVFGFVLAAVGLAIELS